MKPKGGHSLTMAISEQYKQKQRKTPYRLKVYDHYINFGISNQQQNTWNKPDNSTPSLPCPPINTPIHLIHSTDKSTRKNKIPRNHETAYQLKNYEKSMSKKYQNS